MKRPPLFTVFIPTYNRAHTLPRALDSVAAQTFRDLELVIVDDGSSDHTEALVRAWKDGQPFPVTYVQQPNRGKHAAHNTALEHARGELTVILDSDDALVPDALAQLEATWESIPAAERDDFAGVEGLCVHMEDGAVAGSRYPDDPCDATYHEIRYVHGVTGDKKGAYRTDLLCRYPYPRFEGERHVRPSLLWERLSERYRVRHVNRPIQRIEYQPTGLSSDRFSLRLRNPRGFALYFREAAERFRRDAGLRVRLRLMAKFVRYALHAGEGPLAQWRTVRHRALWLLAFPYGWLARQIDRLRQRRKR